MFIDELGSFIYTFKVENINMTLSLKNTAKFLAFSVVASPVLFANNVNAADLGIKGPDQQQSIQAVVTPGQKLETYIEIVNTNKTEAKTGTVLSKDLLIQDDGGFNVIATDQENTGVAKWVNLSQSIVDVEPGAIKKVPLTIDVPSDAKSGEYVAGLTIMDNQPDSQMGNVKIVSRVAIQMHLAVVGDLNINASIQDLGTTKMAGKDELAGMFLNTKNEGNLATKSNINMVLKGPEDYKLDKNVDAFFFPSDKNYSKPLQIDYAGWKNGKYEMTVDMVNNPINKALKTADVKYTVKKQHIVFNFDYADGVLSNLKIVENKKWDTLEPKNVIANEKNNVLNILLILLSLAALTMLIKSLAKNKNFQKDEYKKVASPDAQVITNKTFKDPADAVKTGENIKVEQNVEQKEKVKYNNSEEEKAVVKKDGHTVIGGNKNKTIYDKTETDKNNRKIRL